jgi:hypothetical protein
MSVQQMTVAQLSNPEDKDKLLKIIRECSDAMTRMSGEKDYIKEAVTDISEELDIPKRLVNRMVKVYHKQNYDEEVAIQDQFQTLYETVIK